MRVLALLWAVAAWAAPHPLAPLTAAEIRDAVRIFRASGHAPSTARFHFISLQEPPKDAVLKRAAVPRQAFAVIYDRATNKTGEAVADLAAGKLASWKEVPGAQPPIGDDDSGLADRLVRSDPRWSAALRARRVNPAEAFTVAWPAGYFGLPGEDGSRVVRVTPYIGSAGSNYHAHPVEGVAAFVDLTNRKILEFIDVDRNAPVTRHDEDFDADSVRPLRPAAPPIQITTPQGPGYRIEDGEVRWEKWRFRFALHPREGLVLYTVGYDDGGRTRSVLYRAGLSEMAVPYGDPGRAWFFRNTFDAGELGLGILATSLRPGVDCPQNCQVFPATVASESGQPREIPAAVGIFDRETSIAWTPGRETRAARVLVKLYSSTCGTYWSGWQ
jgi:primary-amine oxidase